MRHGAGVSTFEHEHGGIATKLTLGVAPDDPVKLSLLQVTNRGTKPRTLTVTSYVEWTLGVLREHTQHQVLTSFDPARRAILARNTFDPQFAERDGVLRHQRAGDAHTGDRREFLGRNGTTSAPRGLDGSVALDARPGAGIDPCAALQCALTLAPGETRKLSVALGAGRDEADALRLAEAYGDAARARAAVDETIAQWQRRLSVIARQHAGARVRRDGQSLVAVSGARPAGCGRARRSISRAARTASATSCRT